MTLPELLPSIGRSGEPPIERELWPRGTRTGEAGELMVGGVSIRRVAAQVGTPWQVLDGAEVRRRGRAFRQSVPEAEILFAGKANPAGSVFRWMAGEGLSLDVCSAGEIAV